MAEQPGTTPTPTPAAGAAPQGPVHQLRLRMDESHLSANYTNAFRTYLTAEEVIIDFGLNLVTQPPREGEGAQAAGELLFQLNDRVIMNYRTAKLLAINVGRIVRQFEERFGEIPLGPTQPAKNA